MSKTIATLVTLTALLITSSTGYSAEVNRSKAMVIEGIIAQGNILPLGKQLLDKSNAGEKEVHLVISSPGGEVTTGFTFINLMQAAQANGLRIVCFVPTVAASMAYQIFLHCDERHVLNNSFLLWHRARTVMGGMFGSAMTSVDLLRVGTELATLDKNIFSVIASKMSEVSAETLRYHFDAETLHQGRSLHEMAPNFVTTHTAIKDVFETILDPKVPRNATVDRKALRINQFIYISDYFM